MGEHESQRAFARRIDSNPGYVAKLKAEGKLVMVTGDDGRELVDVDASIARMEDSRDPAKAYMAGVNARQRAEHRGQSDPPESEPSGLSKNATYLQAKTDEQVYLSQLRQLELEEKRGLYLLKSDVEKTWAEKLTAFREAATTMVYRVTPLLAVESDPTKVHALLQKEVTVMLADLAGLSRRARPPA